MGASSRRRRPRRARRDPRDLLIGLLAFLALVEGAALLRAHRLRRVWWQPHAAAPSPSGPARIAIIVDDSGNSAAECGDLQAIPQAITVSILPELAYSRATAVCAHRAGKEVMLHLPMEPKRPTGVYPEGYIIRTDMPPSRIKGRLAEALRGVPYVKGVNNHMGSKATEDPRLMEVLLRELKRRGLYFVDSRVTAHSRGPVTARRLGLPFVERDVFLDNVADRAAIERQFAELARIARRRGEAVGICHARGLSWVVLRDQARVLEQEGFRLVPVSSLLRP